MDIDVLAIGRDVNRAMKVFYDVEYNFTSLHDGHTYPLRAFKGDILVVVNTASFCDSASTQYPLLNQLRDRDVRVLGFPCNQFGLHEPGKNEEILKILRHVRPGNGFSPNFPMFEKIEVNGMNEHPLFTFMKSKCDVVASEFARRESLFYNRMKPNDIEWNFHKFLIDHQGRVSRRYNHNVSPTNTTFINDINSLLRKRERQLRERP